MELYLHHGRKTPGEALEDWGPSGPRLVGVIGIHQTYGNAANVFFVDGAACEAAHKMTGWETWDENALTMRWEEDCVVVIGADGVKMFYGDWGLMKDGGKDGREG